MQSVKPPVEDTMSREGRPVSEMDQWAMACSSLRPPRLTYLRSEPRRRMAAATEIEVPGLSMRCSSTRTRPARMRAWARSREAAWPWSTRSLSRRTFGGRIFSLRSFVGFVILWLALSSKSWESCLYLFMVAYDVTWEERMRRSFAHFRVKLHWYRFRRVKTER